MSTTPTCPNCNAECITPNGPYFNFKCGGWVNEKLEFLKRDPCPHTIKTDSDGWIKWKAEVDSKHPCPGKRVEVKWNKGSIEPLTSEANFYWTSGIVHIVAYRILPPAKVEPPAWSKGWHNPMGIDSPGDGYRFPLKEETAHMAHERYSIGEWVSALVAPTYVFGNNNSVTYRVPISTPFPPSPAVKASGSGTKDDPFTGVIPISIDGDEVTFNKPINPTAKEPADEWRDLLPGELVQKGDEACSINKGSWILSCQWKVGGKQGTSCKYRTRRPFPSPAKSPWTLTSHLATHFPEWGDRKPHRDDFTEEMLAGGWRPLMEGEPCNGEEMWCGKDHGWIKQIYPNGKARADGSHYRTKRPLPPTETAGWFPDKGDWYESRVIGEKKWHEPAQALANRAAYEIENRTSVVKHEYRPASPPEKAGPKLDPLLDTAVWAEASNPLSGEIIDKFLNPPFPHHLTTNHEPSPKQEQEPKQTHTTMNTQTPQVGQRWSTAMINSSGEAVNARVGKVLAINEDVILLEFGKRRNAEEVAYTTKEWAKRANVQLDVKPEKVKNTKAAVYAAMYGGPVAIYRPRWVRRLLKSLTKTTLLVLTGAVFSGQIGMALKAAIAFLAGLLAMWLK